MRRSNGDPTERAAIGRAILLAIAGLSMVSIADFATAAGDGPTGLCGGRRYPTSVVRHGASPYIELTVDGVSGPFLLDYGATRSSLSARAFGGPEGSVRTAAISLPGFTHGEFHLARYDDLPLKTEKGQLGVIGADLLSQLSAQFTGDAVFLGPGACEPSVLFAQGLAPIAQNGYFSSDPSEIGNGLPNVPVAFLRLGDVHAWAQIDTGYDDVVHPHSVDINEALHQRLLQSGAQLERVGDINIWTCDGSERRPVYAVRNSALVIEDERGRPIVQTNDFRLILKPANGCGGIAEMTVPAAQLGASFLRLFGATIFDPKSRAVWLGRGADGEKNPAAGSSETR